MFDTSCGFRLLFTDHGMPCINLHPWRRFRQCSRFDAVIAQLGVSDVTGVASRDMTANPDALITQGETCGVFAGGALGFDLR
ncbi:hypothetical protein D3C81_1435810 [compost metagenome]